MDVLGVLLLIDVVLISGDGMHVLPDGDFLNVQQAAPLPQMWTSRLRQLFHQKNPSMYFITLHLSTSNHIKNLNQIDQ